MRVHEYLLQLVTPVRILIYVNGDSVAQMQIVVIRMLFHPIEKASLESQ